MRAWEAITVAVVARIMRGILRVDSTIPQKGWVEGSFRRMAP
jgi:hypothetical protein